MGKLREHAQPRLLKMSRWKYEGHATMAFLLLGRVTGLKDEEISEAWKRGEKDGVISRALKSDAMQI